MSLWKMLIKRYFKCQFQFLQYLIKMIIKVKNPWREDHYETKDSSDHLFGLIKNNKNTIDKQLEIIIDDKKYHIGKIDDNIYNYIKQLKLINIIIIDYPPITT